VPPLRARVNDLAGLLPPERQAQLEARLARYEEETSHQIVLLTVPSLQGDPIEDFSIRVADAWKIGHKGLDNGIIIVFARDERTARIEVGRGLEGVVPDVVASRILRDRMIPLFRAGRVPDGFDAGIDALMAAARGEEIPEARRPRPDAHREGEGPLGLIVMWALLGGFLAAPFRRGRLRPVGALFAGGVAGGLTYLIVASTFWAAMAALLGALFGWISPASAPLRPGRPGYGGWGGGLGGGFGSGGGGFGGGGGGFGGGGGGFGGGGASGSW
jgi:uncharacterized protein